MEVQLVPKGANTYVYKCPFEGPKCDGNKHCHAYESPVKLANNMPVIIKCPVLKNAKISVEIGDNPIPLRAQ